MKELQTVIGIKERERAEVLIKDLEELYYRLLYHGWLARQEREAGRRYGNLFQRKPAA